MEIQPFTKDSWSIGRPIIAEQIPWLRGKDVATILGYGNPRDALQRHVEPEDRTTYSELTKGVVNPDTLSNQQPHEVYINESGLYCLALKSTKPEAKSFKRWVTSEVLPSIRKCGGYGGGAVVELTEQVKELRTAMTALAQRLDPHPQSQAVNGRLDAIEEKVRKIPEYGPRIEMSRGFPVKPDELTAIGVKLEASEDAERLRELGLPTSTFLQEKFPEKKVARINACFAKILKKRRIDLYHEDAEEHKIFIVYHQGAWRIAYFEDDRALMEEVLQAPAMQETIKRHLGDVPTEGERNKRRQTLLTAYAAPPAYDVGGASST